jgi:DNA-binding IclR family transcriptional regulator
MSDWRFLTRHARALLVIALEPESRLRDIASALNVTERTAFGIVVDLTHAGYLAKEKEGRRNRYHVQEHLPLHDSARPRVVSEFLEMFIEPR